MRSPSEVPGRHEFWGHLGVRHIEERNKTEPGAPHHQMPREEDPKKERRRRGAWVGGQTDQCWTMDALEASEKNISRGWDCPLHRVGPPREGGRKSHIILHHGGLL